MEQAPKQQKSVNRLLDIIDEVRKEEGIDIDYPFLLEEQVINS